MSFLEPLLLSLLGLLPVIVLLYLLKLRRTPVIISSTMLWFRSLQDLTANAPFQRLRKNLLLFLQLLIVTLLAIAAARPFVKSKGVSGNNLCLLIDRSASMQTMEGEKTRLDLAKEKALEMIEQMAGSDKMMVVTFDQNSDVLCELSDDHYKLKSAIRSIKAVDTGTKIRDAVLVASSLQATQPDMPTIVPDLRTIVLSDGKIADIEEIGARAFDVSFLQVGETKKNAGLIGFSIRDPLEGQTGDRQCLILVRNESDEPLDTTVTLSLDDNSLAVEPVKVPAGESGEVLFALAKDQTGVLKAVLDTDDALKVDNTAWLVLKPASKVKVLLVADAASSGSYFLKRVFALDPRVELSTITPSNYSPATKYDMTVFDNTSPATLPEGQLLFINSLPPVPGVSEKGEIEHPAIVATDADHPLMRFLNPSNVTIVKAKRLELPPESRVLVSTQGAPLVADVSRAGQQMVVMAFDLGDTNWPLRLSFPLFFQNVITWVPRSALESQTDIHTGDPLGILPSESAAEAIVKLPDGTTEPVKLDATRTVYFGNTLLAGLYEIAIGEKKILHAVNLTNNNESAITPASSLQIGRSQVTAQRAGVEQNREFWPWLVIAALAVLALEWWVYSRRAWM
jgi:Ca-activated chloride channel family protein